MNERGWRRPARKVRIYELCRGEALACKGERRSITVDADQRTVESLKCAEDATGTAAELNDRPLRCRRGRPPKLTILLRTSVEVPLVVEEALTGILAQRPGSQRIVSPSALRFARELITSSAARLAIIAVDSAQSYGGETSRMSIPATGTRAAI